MTMTTRRFKEELIEQLEKAGYDDIREAYSGRGMYGRTCVGVIIEDLVDLFVLGQRLGEDWPTPMLDNMGKKYIAYFPSIIE